MLTQFLGCRTTKATVTFYFLLLPYTLSFKDCQLSRITLMVYPGRVNVPRLPHNPATELLDIKLLPELVSLTQPSYQVDSSVLPFFQTGTDPQQLLKLIPSKDYISPPLELTQKQFTDFQEPTLQSKLKLSFLNIGTGDSVSGKLNMDFNWHIK